MSAPTRYVLCVAIHPNGQFAVGITKLKGPSFLLNKVTFPGGHIEDGETPLAAAVRELKEECGLTVDESAFHLLDVVANETREMHVFAAVTDKVLHARQQEVEPVWILDVEAHLGYAQAQPNQYASDFINNLLSARVLVLSANPTPLALAA